ncbi:50S ribosomal protein L32 [Lactiplantibacillus xiangfangensis]|uniref:50S ribosomal protein L32 n=1 Tax=Lactiplantibacillus xiangfangensis TaxID=942150 RepID=UPI0009F87D0B|nr:50S ribosomal protein L32 [Lactiplantibacillus xiangfangensis]
MAVPKRRTSKMRKRNRRGHIKLATLNLAPCPNCGELRVSHRVCPSCGFYNGKQVVKVNN